ncbi:MAG: hypothetical protein WC736_09875 [Gallionella sp.]|jgi:hypothetical protein
MQPNFMKPQEQGVNYIILLVVITMGVAFGNLLSNWVTAKVANYLVEQSFKAASLNLAEQVRSQQAENQVVVQRNHDIVAQQQDKRAVDATGIRLFKLCSDWRKAESELRSYTARTEAAKHCSIYERYVNTGESVP